MNDLIPVISALRKADKQLLKQTVIEWANKTNLDYLGMTDLELYARYIEANVDMPQFHWEDKTGRGFTGKWSLVDILAADDEKSDDDISLHEWAQDCEVGDEWVNRTDKYIRIK